MSKEYLQTPKNDSESITIQLQCLKLHYNFVTNQVQFIESWNAWQKFLTVQNFCHKFSIDLQIARTDYGQYNSVKILMN